MIPGASARIASVMARKSSTAWLGVPSGRREWMWIITPPSAAIRRASAPYSSGVYGIAGHCSRLASAPEIAQVRITGSSRAIGFQRRKWAVPLPTLTNRAAARNDRELGDLRPVGVLRAAILRQRRARAHDQRLDRVRQVLL